MHINGEIVSLEVKMYGKDEITCCALSHFLWLAFTHGLSLCSGVFCVIISAHSLCACFRSVCMFFMYRCVDFSCAIALSFVCFTINGFCAV
jgi:hypothetical protein